MRILNRCFISSFAFFSFFIILVSSAPLLAQARPLIEMNYYKIQGGHKEEWLDLYRRNHLPILLDHKQNGLIEDVRLYEISAHQLEPGYDYLVMIHLKNWTLKDEMEKRGEELTKRLYPDEKKFKEEENRRWELTERHWDEVVRPVKEE